MDGPSADNGSMIKIAPRIKIVPSVQKRQKKFQMFTNLQNTRKRPKMLKCFPAATEPQDLCHSRRCGGGRRCVQLPPRPPLPRGCSRRSYLFQSAINYWDPTVNFEQKSILQSKRHPSSKKAFLNKEALLDKKTW